MHPCARPPVPPLARPFLRAVAGIAAVVLGGATLPAVAGYIQTNLVSDVSGLAAFTDPNLVNPWGMASSATSPIWVSDNGTGVSTLYNGSGVPQALVVTIPPHSGGTPPSTPTGQVFNGGSGFELTPGTAARFLFATEDGTISGWSSGTTTALLKVDNSSLGAVYTGLAIGNNASSDFLYAANFASGKIDVFDNAFAPATLAGAFTDPNLPSGYAPFNIQNIGGKVYVTYAKQDASGKDVVAGAGYGHVSEFDTNGNFIRRIISAGALDSPWGLALAPVDFGEYGGDLLVGNFGDGLINAFDLTTGALLGALTDIQGTPIAINGLRGLRFGNGGNGGLANELFFTGGIQLTGAQLEDGQHYLFGKLTATPEPATLALVGLGIAGMGYRRRRIATKAVG